MITSTKKAPRIIAGISSLIAVGAVFALTGCASSHRVKADLNTYTAPATTAIKTSVQGAKGAVAAATTANKTSLDLQAKLDSLIQQNSEAWAYWQQEKLAHQQVETDLAEATAQLTVLEKQLADYEDLVSTQTNTLNKAVSDKNAAIADRDTALKAQAAEHAAAAKWRGRTLWTWGLLLAIALAIAAWKFGPQLAILGGKVLGAVIKTP